MKTKTLMALFLLAWVTGWTGPLTAQEQSPSQLLEQATDLAREERFDEAIGIWLGVLDRLNEDDLAVTEKKLGIAFQQTGRLPEAWHYLSLYVGSSTGEGDEAMAGWLQEVETSLKQTHMMVTLTCDPPGSVLGISASQSPSFSVSQPCPLVWWFLPGQYQVQAAAPGYQPRTVEIDVRKTDDSGMREIRLAGVVPDGPSLPDSTIDHRPSTIVKPAEPKKPSRGLEWALLGSGLALGVTGAIFHGLGYSRNEELDAEYSDPSKHPYGPDAKKEYDAAFRDDVRPKKVTAYVLYGVGGAALVAGIVTWAVRKPGGESGSAAPVTVVPLTLPGGAGAMMTLEF